MTAKLPFRRAIPEAAMSAFGPKRKSAGSVYISASKSVACPLCTRQTSTGSMSSDVGPSANSRNQKGGSIITFLGRQRLQEETMRSTLRKSVIAASAVFAIATTTVALSSSADARWGGGGWHGGGWRGGPGFVGRSAFIGRPGFVGRPFFRARHFAFRRGFVGPFVGAGVLAAGYGYSTCWTWVPTAWGWRRVWACGPTWGASWGPSWGWGGGWGGWGW